MSQLRVLGASLTVLLLQCAPAAQCAEPAPVVMEAHEWGAMMRGAPIVPDPHGNPDYRYTGHAEKSRQDCLDEGERLNVTIGVTLEVCGSFYRWRIGSAGNVVIP